MFKDLKVRFLVIVALMAMAGFALYQRGVVLGLDLQGGTHLAMEIDDPTGVMPAAQRADATERALTVLRTRIDELGVAEPVIQRVGEDRIVVELPGIREEGRAKEILQRSAFLQFQIVRPITEIEPVLSRMDRAIADAGVAEPAPAEAETPTTAPAPLFQPTPQTPAEGDTAVVADAATTDTAVVAAATTRPLSGRLIPTGSPGAASVPAQFAVAEEDIAAVQRYLALPEVQRLIPRGSEFRWGHQRPDQPGYRTLYLLETRPMMTGEHLIDASAQRDPQFGQPVVLFELDRRGGRLFQQATRDNVNEFMAIVLDDRVFSAPVIRSEISNRGQIEMAGGSIEEARDLALVLRAGALPAPLRIIEERTVGPSLGADSIERGQLAGMIGIGLVIIIMMIYYRFAGVMAVVALGIYLLFVMGGLAGIGAALTLPGIAGLVLSIGMAVDANVLIFERIREELAAGRSPRMAVQEGFGHALSAIVDSNLTTLITAAILFQFGTGPIQGFAVTLAIGIIASMFTAIFITRTFFMLYLERRQTPQTISI